MSKKAIIILIFFGILILVSLFFYQLRNNPLIITHPTLSENACNKDDDCVLSENHPSSTGVCVNQAWQDEWNKNPISKNFITNCIIGPVCSGREFVAGGMKMPKSCQCVNNRCATADLSNYPGCQMVGCD